MSKESCYHRTLFLCIALACVLGVALRVASAGGELWLDEMWSVVLVHEGARFFSDILLSIHHDNNHLLTSAWLWFAGAEALPGFLRAPSIVCGSLTIVILAWGSKYARDATEYVVWFLLCAFSYPFILYSSEARGYACMVFGVVVAFWALWVAVERVATRFHAILFAAASAFAILAHATALLFLVPVSVWCVVGSLLKRARIPRFAWLVCAFVPPYTMACGLWLLHYRQSDVGGGLLLPYWQVILSTVSTACGGEELSVNAVDSTIFAAFLSCSIGILVGVELVLWVREGSRWAWLIATGFTTAIGAIVVSQPETLAPRHLLLGLLPGYYLIARFVMRLSRHTVVGKMIAVGLVGAYLISSTKHVWDLMFFGRSHFVEIFTDIQRERPGARVGGDQDYRNAIRMQYVQLVQPDVGSLTYVPQYMQLAGVAAQPPDVVIREGSDRYEGLPEELSLPSGETYHRVHEYRAPLLSGSRCGVYWRR